MDSLPSELSLRYWRIGQRIQTDILGGQRADQGQQTLQQLSKALTAYGNDPVPKTRTLSYFLRGVP